MRELVLNHASLHASDSRAAVGFLKDLATGISQLVHDGVAGYALRAAQGTEIACAPGYSLWDAMQALPRADGRDEHVFLMKMATKAPLLADVPEDVKHRFLTCETREYSLDDGAPLLYCALVGGIAVGFPTGPEWDRDQLAVEFDELQEDGTFNRESETIDHLARVTHATSIWQRYRQRLRSYSTAHEVWTNRHAAFPNLVFGSDVEDRLDRSLLDTIIGKLAALDDAAGAWRVSGGNAPSWTCKVTNESKSVRNDPKYREARRFNSNSGERKLFMWHARYGDGGRIHLLFDAKRLEVEIGYIGPHLPP